jgi:hypothetical protein
MQRAGSVAERDNKLAAMKAQPVRADSFLGQISMIGRGCGRAFPDFRRPSFARFLFSSSSCLRLASANFLLWAAISSAVSSRPMSARHVSETPPRQHPKAPAGMSPAQR